MEEILISAYGCEPDKGSEPGAGWNWAIEVAKRHSVTVLTRANNRDTIEKEFVAVITLENEGVPFKRMDDPNEEVEAKVVFVLGLNQPHQQLEMLQSLMAFIQDNEKLKQLETAQTVDDVKEVF